MKYCVHCGTGLADEAKFCSKCGKPVGDSQSSSSSNSRLIWDSDKGVYVVNPNAPKPSNNVNNNNNYRSNYRYDNSSLHGGTVGFLLTFFLGLIGFILCLCLGDEDCKSAAKKTFIICLIIGLVIGLFIGCGAACVLDDYEDDYYYYDTIRCLIFR